MKTDYQKFLVRCTQCGGNTSKQYARAHGGFCKTCCEGESGGRKPWGGERDGDTHHDYIASGARAAGVSFSDC